MLQTRELNFTVVECDFCGTVYIDEANAALYKRCMNGEPPQKIELGTLFEKFQAFDVQVDSTVVGRESAQAKIVRYSKPEPPPFGPLGERPPLQRARGGQNVPVIEIAAPLGIHDWRVHIEPVDFAAKTFPRGILRSIVISEGMALCWLGRWKPSDSR